MKRFRYRTCALVGPWRSTREQAMTDAVRSGQASRPGPGGLVWHVAGTIERANPGEPAPQSTLGGAKAAGEFHGRES